MSYRLDLAAAISGDPFLAARNIVEHRVPDHICRRCSYEKFGARLSRRPLVRHFHVLRSALEHSRTRCAVAYFVGDELQSQGGDMKLNINDASKLTELKATLAATNVSPTAIRTLEKALRSGMTFTRSEDLRLLDIPATDVNVVREAVVFGPRTTVVANLKTVEY